MYSMSVVTTVISITYVGGPGFFIGILVLGVVYYNVAKVYGQCSRDMRRLDSVSRSPLYSIYGETISGVPILRAFGAGSKFMRDMLSCVDTNTNPYYWLWGVNRWVSTRFNLLSSAMIGITAVVALLNPRVDASLAGFTLAFASTVTNDVSPSMICSCQCSRHTSCFSWSDVSSASSNLWLQSSVSRSTLN